MVAALCMRAQSRACNRGSVRSLQCYKKTGAFLEIDILEMKELEITNLEIGNHVFRMALLGHRML